MCFTCIITPTDTIYCTQVRSQLPGKHIRRQPVRRSNLRILTFSVTAYSRVHITPGWGGEKSLVPWPGIKPGIFIFRNQTR